MSRTFSRLVLMAAVVTGFGVAPFLSASAATVAVPVKDPANGGFNPSSAEHKTEILLGDEVTWFIQEGTHTITPDGTRGQKWVEGSSGELDTGKEYTANHFTVAGNYYYFCKLHEGMAGYINVKDPNPPPTTPPTTAAPTTTTTTARPVATTPTTAAAPAPAASAGTKPPVTAAPAPAPATTAPAKPEKDKKPKDGSKDGPKDGTTSSSTETTVPPPAPVDIPDSAIIPALPGSGTVVQEGAVAPGPATLEGQAAANHRNKPRRKGMKLLIASGLGISALGIGTAGYKFANRSSKYFPA